MSSVWRNSHIGQFYSQRSNPHWKTGPSHQPIHRSASRHGLHGHIFKVPLGGFFDLTWIKFKDTTTKSLESSTTSTTSSHHYAESWIYPPRHSDWDIAMCCHLRQQGSITIQEKWQLLLPVDGNSEVYSSPHGSLLIMIDFTLILLIKLTFDNQSLRENSVYICLHCITLP